MRLALEQNLAQKNRAQNFSPPQTLLKRENALVSIEKRKPHSEKWG